VPDSGDKPGASGMLFETSALLDVEARIADAVTRYHSTPPDARASWLREHFGETYPVGIEPASAISDIIARAINSGTFASTFACPTCGRLALAKAPGRDSWVFYSPEQS